LARDVAAEISVRDPRWAKQIQSEIGQTEVTIRGVIEQRHFSLEDIATQERAPNDLNRIGIPESAEI
jgi:flagellar motor switch protein FliM